MPPGGESSEEGDAVSFDTVLRWDSTTVQWYQVGGKIMTIMMIIMMIMMRMTLGGCDE